MVSTAVAQAHATLQQATQGTPDWSAVAAAAQSLADVLGREEELRSTLGREGLPSQAAALLQRSDIIPPARLQLCRLVGNLCAGEQDENRQQCFDAAVTTGLAQALTAVDDVLQLKAAVGASLNLSMDYEPAYAAYASSGLLNALITLLRPGTLQPLLAQTEQQETARHVLSWTMQIVEDILQAKTPLPAPLLHEVVATLCSIILSFSPSHGAAEINIDQLVTSAELLEAITLDEDSATGAFIVKDAQPLSLLCNLCDFVEAKSPPIEWSPAEIKQFDHVKAAVAKVITAAAADSTVMDAAFAPSPPSHDLLEILLSWIRREDEGERADLLITSTIALGNLARSDPHCVTLAQEHGLVATLAKIFFARTQSGRDRSKGRPGENSQVLHGVTGLLKHLSIPAANKTLIGETGLIEAVASLLKPTYDIVQPLQHNTVGLLKHLCAQHLANTLRILSPPVLTSILDLLDRVDDVRLRSETTRILANAARSLWNANLSPPDSSITIRDEARAQVAASSRVASALAEMVRTSERYPVLVNEGIAALVVISTHSTGARNVMIALSIEKRSSVGPAAAAAAANGYTPSPATTAPMPFSVRTAGEGNAPQSLVRSPKVSSSSRQSTMSNGGTTKPTTAALALAGYIANVGLPVEIRGNACALIEIVTTQARPTSKLRKALEGNLEAVKDTAVEQPTLRMAAERAWRRLTASV